ncbi:PQQ-binding-like beta-propeller repeat protein [Sinomonas susongensis]|uniref:outer membrane protein assembly factor BamB family protein n=1 Tax=Sinomonas susongensis TaxID=1324851 RepID=UPI00110A0936|nr:PQQ-binding-like beta-propeller repeat protein [Sinomonas susongensis]
MAIGAALAVAAFVVVACSGSVSEVPSEAPTTSTGGSSGPRPTAPTASATSSATPTRTATATPSPSPDYLSSLVASASGEGHLQPGSDPSALAVPILIADKLNNRVIIVDPQGRVIWQYPRPGDLKPGETFAVPDDAFFTPDGKQIVATEEDDEIIRVIDLQTHTVTYHYGTAGIAAATAGHVHHPDDALMLPGGTIMSADIMNCRLIAIPAGGTDISRQFGDGQCVHNPPASYGSPNGAFPLADGNFLVTEINGSWIDEISPKGELKWSVRLPSVAYPSDTNEVRPGVYLTVDYSASGQIVEFDNTGKILWRYAPTGAQALDHPSLALPLPNGDVLANDDYNHRVIVVDPRMNQIVWQYGVDHVAGDAPGLLANPDGVDLYPPDSLMITHAATVGRP